MRAANAVLRRELGSYVDSPVAWVMCALFVFALHVSFFLIGYPIGDLQLSPFWAGRVAALDGVFAWLPLYFCLLAPAVTMGGWAEERRSGTDELLLTQPVHLRQLVLGKFLAAWILLGAIATCAVLPLALVVSAVGPLDWGAVLGGLSGAWMLAAVCIAIGLVASALAREELVAFLIAVGVLISLWGMAFFIRVLPPSLAEAAWYASPTLHFTESSARGLFDLRDIVYYGLFTLGGLVLNVAILEGRRWR